MKKERLAGEKENIFFQRFIKMTKKEAKAYEAGMQSSEVFTDIGIRTDTKNKDGRWLEVILYKKKQRETCCECGESVKPGSGKFVNRVAGLNDYQQNVVAGYPYPEGAFICAECYEIEG